MAITFRLLLSIGTLAGLAQTKRQPDFTLSPDCAPDCTPIITSALHTCPIEACSIVFAPGVYPVQGQIGTTIASVSGQRSLSLTGIGATILLLNLTALFSFDGVDGLRVSGLTFDMAREPFTLGYAISTTPSAFTLRFNESASPFPESQGYLRQMQALLQFDPARGRPAVNGLDVYALDSPGPIINISQGLLTIVHPCARQVVVGQWYIVRHHVYGLNTLTLNRCSNAMLENLTIFTAAGMGMYAQLSSNVAVVGVRIVKAPGRSMSITADALHFNACNGSVLISDSIFEGQGDDGLNVHGKFGVVETVTLPSTIALAPATATEHSGILAMPGDLIEFRDRNTFQPYATARLEALSGLVAQVDAIPSNVKPGDLVVSLTWEPSLTVRVLPCCCYRKNHHLLCLRAPSFSLNDTGNQQHVFEQSRPWPAC